MSQISVKTGSGDGLLPVRYQTIAWSNVELLLIGHKVHTVKLESNNKTFHSKKCTWNVVYKMVAICSDHNLLKGPWLMFCSKSYQLVQDSSNSIANTPELLQYYIQQLTHNKIP